MAEHSDLVLQAIDGDEMALTILLTESRSRLCAQVARHIPAKLRENVSEEDVVQEAHIEVFRRIGTFEMRAPDAFHRWITTIALRRLRTKIQRHRTAKRGGRHNRITVPKNLEHSTVMFLDKVAGKGQTPSRIISRREALGVFEAAFEKLPEQYRQAVWLVHIEGRPVKEAAARLGRTERAIHGLCRRAMEQLRGMITSDPRLTSSG